MKESSTEDLISRLTEMTDDMDLPKVHINMNDLILIIRSKNNSESLQFMKRNS